MTMTSSTSDDTALVRTLGEKQLIQGVLSAFAHTAQPDHTEDCIVIDPARLGGSQDGPLIVYSVDHPSRIDRPLPPGFGWRFHGRWIAACTCNDVLAMGAQPRGLSMDLAVSPETAVSDIRALYQGITDVVGEYGAQIEGGNTAIGDRTETVAMCWGTVARDGLIRRRGARVGDYLVVTTELGLGWAMFVLRKTGRWADLSSGSRQLLEQYNVMPLAPHAAIVESARELPGAITSGMDLSDGLAEFLYIILRSGKGVIVDESRLPCSSTLGECAGLLGVPSPMFSLEYGFDMPRSHGFTVNPRYWEQLREIFARHGSDLFRIGEVVSEPAALWRRRSGAECGVPAIWDDKCHRLDAVERWFEMIRDMRGDGH